MPRLLRPRLILGLALGLALVASSRREAPVSLMVGGIGKQIYLPVVLAQRLGYFRDEGLDVHLLSEPAGVEAADEMLAGAVQGVIGFDDHNIQLQSVGKYTESVVQFSRVPGEVELVSTRYPGIRTVADLTGRRVGVTDLGSSTDFLTEYLIKRSGLNLSEVTPVPVGAGDTLIAALAQDKIQAAMTTEPTISRLVSSGAARVLVDLRSLTGTKAALGGPYPAACLYMETSWVNTHTRTVQKLADALVRALRFISTYNAAAIAAHMPSSAYAGDKALYVSALAAGKEMFTPDGRMPAGGPETVLRVLSRFMPGVEPGIIDLTSTYTTKFVDAVR